MPAFLCFYRSAVSCSEMGCPVAHHHTSSQRQRWLALKVTVFGIIVASAVMSTFVRPSSIISRNLRSPERPAPVVEPPLELSIEDFGPCLPEVNYSTVSTAERSSLSGSRPLPLLATNLDHDTERFLTRLVDGWDVEAQHKLIVAGACDPAVTQQLTELRRKHGDLTILRQSHAMGCSGGWNTILDYWESLSQVQWAVVLNNDVETPPGSLAKFTEEVWNHVDQHPNFCIGYLQTLGGQNFSAFVMTRRGLELLGRFDGNIYPAYFEDTDMRIRLNLAASRGVCDPEHTFMSAAFKHGYNSNEYLSGSTIVRMKMSASSDMAVRDAERRWSLRMNRGFRSSEAYLKKKWNFGSSSQFSHPFDNSSNPLSYWVLDRRRRECIDHAPASVQVCEYEGSHR